MKFHNHQRNTYTLDKMIPLFHVYCDPMTQMQRKILKRFHTRKQRQWNKTVLEREKNDEYRFYHFL